ncbi:MAG TPA: hypothetical protein VHP32_04695 [Ignavibacteria bacterium]|nr:hypothetical protein [Ignavibacteria bacterium]
MAANKISELTELTEIGDSDILPVVSGGETKRITLDNLLAKAVRIDKPNQIESVDSKEAIADDDIIMIEDSDDANSKKKITREEFLSDTIRMDKSDQISGLDEKTSIHENDIFLIEDSEGGNDKKMIKVSTLRDGLALIVEGEGAPGSAPAKTGSIYIDTATDAIYISKGTTGTDDWVSVG